MLMESLFSCFGSPMAYFLSVPVDWAWRNALRFDFFIRDRPFVFLVGGGGGGQGLIFPNSFNKIFL